MCRICDAKSIYEGKFDALFQRIKSEIASTPQDEGTAFSTIPFPPKINFALFEPRMALQLPSNFYQHISVDGQKVRNDWTSGWLRAFGFYEGKLFFIAHAFKFDKPTATERIIFLYIVEFERGEWTAQRDVGKIAISVNKVKSGKNLITGEEERHSFAFSFLHTPTQKAIIPADRIETSALVRSIYRGKLPQKPLTFDWTKYVVTTPHFAPHGIIHQNFKEFGYTSAIDMQNAVTDLLLDHIKV